MEMSNEQVTQEFFHSLNNSYYKAAVKEFEYRLKETIEGGIKYESGRY